MNQRIIVSVGYKQFNFDNDINSAIKFAETAFKHGKDEVSVEITLENNNEEEKED